MKLMCFTVNHNKEKRITLCAMNPTINRILNRLFVDLSSYMRAYVHVRGQISVNSNYICESR